MTARIEDLNQLMEVTGLTQSDISEKMGWSRAQVSRIAAREYPNWRDKLAEACRYLSMNGYVPEEYLDESGPSVPAIAIDTSAVIMTDNYNAVFNLADGLLAPESLLNASIGMVLGKAGYGKTTAVKRYAVEHMDAVYVLYMGFSRTSLFKRIAEEMVGRSAGTYFGNIKLIEEVTSICRKLIIIDEADRIPLSILEDLRTLNENAGVPVLLVGEDSLSTLVKKADRIESRIRKPIVTFKPIDTATVMALYKKACGLSIDVEIAKRLIAMCRRDFRVAVNDMQHIISIMNQNSMSELTKEVLDECKRR